MAMTGKNERIGIGIVRWCILMILAVTVLFQAGCGSSPGGKVEKEGSAKVESVVKENTQESSVGENPFPGGVMAKELTLPTAANNSYKIGVLLPHLKDPYWVSIAYGLHEEAKLHGVSLTLLTAGGYQYIDKQINQLNDLSVKGVDIVLLAAVDSAGTVAAVDSIAKSGGPPILNFVTMTDSKNVVARIAPADWELGYVTGDLLGKLLNGKGNVVMLNGPAGASWSTIRDNAFKAVIQKKYPEIRILAERWTEMDRAVGMSTTEDILQRFDKIDALFTPGDILAQGAADAVRTAGREKEIKIATTAVSKPTEEMIREGRIAVATSEQPVEMGRWGMRLAIKHLNGEKIPELVKIPLQIVTPDTIDTKFDRTTEYTPEGWKLPN